MVRPVCQLRLRKSGVCVMPLADLLLLLIHQVTNLFESVRHRFVNGELANGKVIYSFVHHSHTLSAFTLLSTHFALLIVGAAKFFLYF